MGKILDNSEAYTNVTLPGIILTLFIYLKSNSVASVTDAGRLVRFSLLPERPSIKKNLLRARESKDAERNIGSGCKQDGMKANSACRSLCNLTGSRSAWDWRGGGRGEEA